MEEQKDLDEANRKLAETIANINKDIVKKVIPLFPKEAQGHLAKSYTEFLRAVQSLTEKKAEKEKKKMKKVRVE